MPSTIQNSIDNSIRQLPSFLLSKDDCEACEKQNEIVRENFSNINAYLFSAILSLFIVVFLIDFYQTHIKPRIDKNREKQKFLDTIKWKQELKTKAQAIVQQEIKSKLSTVVRKKENWKSQDEQNKDPAYLAELDQLLALLDELDQEEIKAATNKIANNNELSKNTANHGKISSAFEKAKDGVIQARTMQVTTKDSGKSSIKIQSWDDYSHQYIYQLNSRVNYIYINRFLLEYLKLNHREAMTALLHLAENRNDSGAKKKSGFFIKDKPEKLDSAFAKQINANKKKREANQPLAKKTDKQEKFIKGKITTENFRFFGQPVAIKDNHRLFEINGWKAKHKQKEVEFFPLEAEVQKLRSKVG